MVLISLGCFLEIEMCSSPRGEFLSGFEWQKFYGLCVYVYVCAFEFVCTCPYLLLAVKGQF